MDFKWIFSFFFHSCFFTHGLLGYLSNLLMMSDQLAVAGRLFTASPDFLPAPANVSYHRGELAVLRCTVFNLGTKNVIWRRIDQSFPLTVGAVTVASDDRLQVGHVGYKSQWDLMIKNVQPEDEGVYECQIPSRDKTMRRQVALTVLDPETDSPEIQITGSQFVEKGERIVLQCNATGEYYPPDEMDWFRNGERLSSQRHRGVRITKQYSISKRTFTSVLVVDRADMADQGTYVCRSSNMQISSIKVHVLNAETFNKKRGTVNEKQKGEIKQLSNMSGRLQTFTSTAFIIIIVSALHII